MLGCDNAAHTCGTSAESKAAQATSEQNLVSRIAPESDSSSPRASGSDGIKERGCADTVKILYSPLPTYGFERISPP